MNAQVIRDLHRRVKWLEENALQTRRGEITATSPLTVKLGASDVEIADVKRAASYSPTIGDQVQVLRWGKDLYVDDEIA